VTRCLLLYRQLPWFRIEAEQAVHMNLDGEPMLASTFDFRVLKQRLSVILPDDAFLQ